jgi:TolB-like protein
MPGGLLLCAVLLYGAPGRAADAKSAASTIAKEIVDGVRKVTGHPPKLVLLGELRGPTGDPAVAELTEALVAALVKERGVPLVDRESLKAAIAEAVLEGDARDADLTEIAGAFGAELLVAGDVNKIGADYSVNARAIQTQTGEVLVSVKASFTRGGGQVSAEAATLESQLRRLSDRLALGLDGLKGELRYQRVAVLPFQEVGANTQDKQLGLLVSSELMTWLRRDHNLMMVERSQVAALIDEMALGQLGVVDENQSAEVGRMAGAQGLVIGTVSEAGDKYLVNARVVGTESGQVVVAEEVPLPAADLVALSSDAVVLRTRTGALYRSLLLPGWGQIYNRQPVKAGAMVGAEAGALGAALAFHIRAVQADDRYDAMSQGDFDKVHDRQVSSRRWRNIFLWTALAVHLINVADAFFSGTTYETADPSAGTAAAFTF